MVAFDGGALDGAVHSFDLTVGPGVVGLGEPMLDAIFAADLVEAMHTHPSGPAIPVAWQVGELDAVVGQDGVQVVGHRFEQGFQERDGGSRRLWARCRSGPPLGSGLVDQSQKMTVAASATAEKKTMGLRRRADLIF